MISECVCFNLSFLANPSVNDLTITTTSTTVTLTWSPPDIVPQSYSIFRACRKLCESSIPTFIEFDSITSPYQFSGINPGSVCTFLLFGVYDSELIGLATVSASTLSTGNIQYLTSVKNISKNVK